MLIKEEKLPSLISPMLMGKKQLKLLYQYIDPVCLLTKRDLPPIELAYFESASIVF